MKNSKKYLIKIGELLLLILAMFSFVISGKEIRERSGEVKEEIISIFVQK